MSGRTSNTTEHTPLFPRAATTSRAHGLTYRWSVNCSTFQPGIALVLLAALFKVKCACFIKRSVGGVSSRSISSLGFRQLQCTCASRAVPWSIGRLQCDRASREQLKKTHPSSSSSLRLNPVKGTPPSVNCSIATGRQRQRGTMRRERADGVHTHGNTVFARKRSDKRGPTAPRTFSSSSSCRSSSSISYRPPP